MHLKLANRVSIEEKRSMPEEPLTMAGPSQAQYQSIDYHMLDHTIFSPLVLGASVSLWTFFYPFDLVKTRLQVQTGKENYKGILDAGVKIFKAEGPRGFVNMGMAINACRAFPSIMYIHTYEFVRHHLQKSDIIHDSPTRALIGGACASMVAQLCGTPFDTVVQKRQSYLLGNTRSARKGLVVHLVKEIHAKEGLGGFWKGFGLATLSFAFGSGIWWFFYEQFNKIFYKQYVLPDLSRSQTQMCAGLVAGVLSCCITNPLDLIRVNIQVKRTGFLETTKTMIRNEGLQCIFIKGLNARIIQNCTMSVLRVSVYEAVKRQSLKAEYSHLNN